MLAVEKVLQNYSTEFLDIAQKLKFDQIVGPLTDKIAKGNLNIANLCNLYHKLVYINKLIHVQAFNEDV